MSLHASTPMARGGRCVLPTNRFNRVLRTLDLNRVRTHHLFVLLLCHLINAKLKWLRQSHTPEGFLPPDLV
jgi:hypothetical protein